MAAARRRPPITDSQRERIASAQGSSLPWDKVCSRELNGLLDRHSKVKGVPKEFILLPLLSAVAALVGTNGCIEISKGWTEPAILWTLVAAKKGSRKSAALGVIQDALGSYRDLIIERFSMAALFDEMHEHDGQLLGLYDEMSTLHRQLHSSDQSDLLTLSNGGQWSRHFKVNDNKIIPRTAFSFAGFIQPDYVVRMLEEDDYDGFNDRHLIICPPEKSPRFEDLINDSDMIENGPQLKDIFDCVFEKHNSCNASTTEAPNRTYKLASEALTIFGAFHDDIEERLQGVETNEAGVLSKAKGQCARLALILHVLKQAFCHLTPGQNATQWSETIEDDTIGQAIVLIEHLIRQKSLLMPKQIMPTTTSAQHQTRSQTCTPQIRFSNQHLEETYPTVERFLRRPSPLKASEVSRNRLCPPVSPSKYPVSSAKEYMREIAEEGFGEVTQERDGRKSSLVFRKRPFSELGNTQKELVLKKLRLSPQEYEYNTPQSDTSQSADTQDSHQSTAIPSEPILAANQSVDQPTATRHDHDQSTTVSFQPATDQSKSQ